MGDTRQQDRVSYNQALLLIVVLRVMVGLTYMPAIDIKPGNQDIWIVLLLSIAYTIVFSLPLVYLSNKFNDLNLLELSEKIMGNFLGKIIGTFYALTLFSLNILSIGTAIEILDSTLFLTTPTWFGAVFLVGTICILSFNGLKGISRLGEIVVPFIIFMIFLLAILGYNNYDFSELLPILGDSMIGEINMGAIEVSLRFIDILILVMITPNLEVKKDLNKIFIRAIIFSILIVIVLIVVTQLTLGIELTKHVNFPFLSFARMINIGRIQGFDAIYITSWIMGNLLKSTVYLYFTTVAFGNVFNKRNQVFIIPISIVTFITVVILKDVRSILATPEPTRTIVTITSFIAIIVIPLTMLVTYLFRRKTDIKG